MEKPALSRMAEASATAWKGVGEALTNLRSLWAASGPCWVMLVMVRKEGGREGRGEAEAAGGKTLARVNERSRADGVPKDAKGYQIPSNRSDERVILGTGRSVTVQDAQGVMGRRKKPFCDAEGRYTVQSKLV